MWDFVATCVSNGSLQCNPISLSFAVSFNVATLEIFTKPGHKRVNQRVPKEIKTGRPWPSQTKQSFLLSKQSSESPFLSIYFVFSQICDYSCFGDNMYSFICMSTDRDSALESTLNLVPTLSHDKKHWALMYPICIRMRTRDTVPLYKLNESARH